jgi:hypothetical protein
MDRYDITVWYGSQILICDDMMKLQLVFTDVKPKNGFSK